jgi:hypothetical protein
MLGLNRRRHAGAICQPLCRFSGVRVKSSSCRGEVTGKLVEAHQEDEIGVGASGHGPGNTMLECSVSNYGGEEFSPRGGQLSYLFTNCRS